MITAQIIQRGIGKGRNPWLIRAFLSGKGTNMSKVAKLAETYPQVVQETVLGFRNHRRTLNVLEKLGCPQEYLYGQHAHKAGRAA